MESLYLREISYLFLIFALYLSPSQLWLFSLILFPSYELLMPAFSAPLILRFEDFLI